MIRKALLATALLAAFDALERNLLGHRPAYDVNRMGRRLFGSARKGWALRCAYAPAMAFAQRRLGIPALLFGPLVAAAELYTMPRVGATPRRASGATAKSRSSSPTPPPSHWP